MAKDRKPVPGFEEWRLLGEEETGIVRQELGPGDLDDPFAEKEPQELSLDDLGADLGFDGPSLNPREQEEADKKAARAKKKKLLSLPRYYKFTRNEKNGGVKATYAKLHPEMAAATGFWGILSPDLSTMQAVYRMPRGAGSVTSAAVAKDGAIYITGTATDRLRFFSKPLRTETYADPPRVGEKTFGARQSYVARLRPDGAAVEWLVQIDGWTIPPEVRVLDNGNIAVHGAGMRTYSPDGKQISVHTIENNRVLGGTGINPTNGDYSVVGDWMSPTGREPYRTPRCAIMDANGEMKIFMYGWRGPFAGIDKYRLIADSAIRHSDYDNQGHFISSSWSHGGNNVMFRHPVDMERWMPNNMKIGTTETVAVLAKMKPDYNVGYGMFWNGNIRQVSYGAEGSVVFLADGLNNTKIGNEIAGAAHGRLLGITDPEMGGYRFIERLPTVGSRAVVNGCLHIAEQWGFATGYSNGKPLLLAFSSAVESELLGNELDDDGAITYQIPTKNPLQSGFGGGLTDGYLIVFDLSADQPYVSYNPPPKKKFQRKDAPPPVAWPDEGQKYTFGAEPYWNAQVHFRDASDNYWPSYYGGKPAMGGVMTWSEEGPARALFDIEFPHLMLHDGSNHRRTLGERAVFHTVEKTTKKGKKVTKSVLKDMVTIQIREMGPWQRLDKIAKVGGVESGTAKTNHVAGTLKIGTTEVPFQDATCHVRLRYPKGSNFDREQVRPNHLLFRLELSKQGHELGLTGALADETINIFSDFSGYYGETPKSGW